MDPVLIKIGSFEVMWYSVLIFFGVILAMMIVLKEGKKLKFSGDFLFNLCFYTIIFGFIGARLYYVVFNFSLYKNELLSILKIWEGGLAIHGGIIFGLITLIIYSKKYKANYVKIIDVIVPGLLIGQAVGRWGNFFNGEAHGPVTSLETLQSYMIPDFIIEGMYIGGNYYHPTFLYESLICIIGFIVVLILRRFKYIKTGSIVAFYLIWYGLGRFFIESLRTDSLMIGSVKIAQVISVIMIIIGIGIMMINSRKGKFEDLYNSEDNAVKF